MNPFIVNQENKNMVEDNITYLLRNFLTNSSFDYVLFSWVIHSEEIFSQLLERLSDLRFRVVKISLISTEAALKERLLRDLKLNLRDEGTIETSLNRLQLYQSMNTNKIDTTNLSVAETADKIIGIIHKEQM
jgi:regulator of PEP synthase PpsR (kinase-PPPase family)